MVGLEDPRGAGEGTQPESAQKKHQRKPVHRMGIHNNIHSFVLLRKILYSWEQNKQMQYCVEGLSNLSNIQCVPSWMCQLQDAQDR